MSNFFDEFAECMHGKGLPLPNVESFNKVKEMIEELHTAWESAGGDEQMLMAALIEVGALTGIDEEALLVLGGIAVTVYIDACVECLAAAGLQQLKELFAANPAEPFMIDKLEEFGVDVAAVADDVVAAIVDETITPAEDEVPPPAEDEVPPPAEDEGPPEVEATSGENNEDAPAESEAAA